VITFIDPTVPYYFSPIFASQSLLLPALLSTIATAFSMLGYFSIFASPFPLYFPLVLRIFQDSQEFMLTENYSR